MTQRPDGQLPSIDSDDPLERLEALLLEVGDENARHQAAELEASRAAEDEFIAALTERAHAREPRFSDDDEPEDHPRLTALRAGRSRKRAKRFERFDRLGRRSAVIAVSGGLLVTMGLPALSSASQDPNELERPPAASAPVAEPEASIAPSTSPTPEPTPTMTVAPGTLVRGTTADGQEVAVVIPAPGPAFSAQVLVQILVALLVAALTPVLAVVCAPLGEWVRRRLGLPASLRD